MFVSRSMHNAIVARLERSLTEARTDAAEQRLYNRTLVQTIVDLKRDGHGAPAVALQPRSRDPVEEAINALAGSNIRERSRLGRYVSLMRTRGRDDDSICNELMNPQPDEDGVSA